jgi:tRNA(Ser,Leu) C12 N-acetylase TAN1
MAPIPDWNVVVTVYRGEFRAARRLLREIAPVVATGYYNVAVMKVEDVGAFIDRLIALSHDRPELLDMVSRAAPLTHVFDFESAADFEAKARAIALGWTPALAGKSFFVRLHRRGSSGHLSSHEEERFLDTAILDALAAAGTPARISFEEPDFVIDVEVVDDRAGLALWTRDDLDRCRFLRTR